MELNSSAEAWAVFTEHPWILLLMPVVGAFIGWITKVLAIWMIFRPLAFVGIGPIGWQGQLPRRAAKFGSHVADIVLSQLIDPRMLIDRLDPVVIAREADEFIVDSVGPIARELIGARWDQLPSPVQAAVVNRARKRAPQVMAAMLEQAKANIDGAFDMTYTVTALLIRDKRILNRMVRDNIGQVMRFMVVFGLVFGGVVGGVQMVVYAFTENTLVIPLFGLLVGLVSDWIALQMVFTPRTPKRFLGVFRWHGMFFKYREDFIRGFAAGAAEEVLTPRVLIEAILDGALADRLFAMVRAEVDQAINAELGPAAPLVTAVIGSARYDAVRDSVVERAREVMPAAADRLEGYVMTAMDVERTAVTAFEHLSDEEYEGLIRPVFKEDEWLVVWLGGALGFAVGELQVHLLVLLGGLH